jgi:hypothetical protein
MPTPYDDEPVTHRRRFCSYCGQELEDGATVRDEPMFDADAPDHYFFCAHCGTPKLGSP